MARYLQSIPAATATSAQPPTNPDVANAPNGKAVYEKHCADCHGAAGAGQPGAYPALADNRAVAMENTSNLILTVLYGGFSPATAGNPRPFGMPPFMLQLGDQDIAAALSYVRSSWGNAAAPVAVFDVHKLRTSLPP
jgi:mono/diheme cytochrome c family protein